MAKGVDAVFFTNWQATGSTVPIDQYELDIEVHWTDEQGQKHQALRTVRFPNCLSDLSMAERKDLAEELMLKAARIQLGVD